MKKTLSLIAAVVLCTITSSAQNEVAVMPTLIVFPSDQWMTESPFKQLIDVNGKTKELYDYQTALKNSRDMKSAIDAVQKALEERKFMAEDLAALLEGFDDESAMELAKTADGEGNETSMVDELLQQAKPDIRRRSLPHSDRLPWPRVP